MSFVDKVKVTFTAGKGGDGRRSFRHERYISRGGPDGGDGGDGGDIVLQASVAHNTLSAFRHKKQLIASDGQPGDKSRKHGRSGEDLVIDVPVGTEISHMDGQIIGDLVIAGEQVVVAKGGRGGFGNAHFTSSTRQAPNFAEKGEAGESLEVTLELKLIADVGIVGLPNAGKSTLLSRLSNAKPEIADYPFTTLSPNLGVVDIDEQTSVLIADIPGLIEGAANGKGLGHEFLRHVERTRLIIHLIDIYEQDIAKSYQVIRNELKAHSTFLAKLSEMVVLNKIDGISEEVLKAKINELKEVIPKKTKLLVISAQAGTNLSELKFTIKSTLMSLKPKVKKSNEPGIPRITLEASDDDFKVVKVDDGFKVSGIKIEKFAQRTDFSNPEAVERLKYILKRMNILHELLRKGLRTGDRVFIGEDGDFSFIY